MLLDIGSETLKTLSTDVTFLSCLDCKYLWITTNASVASATPEATDNGNKHLHVCYNYVKYGDNLDNCNFLLHTSSKPANLRLCKCLGVCLDVCFFSCYFSLYKIGLERIVICRLN